MRKAKRRIGRSDCKMQWKTKRFLKQSLVAANKSRVCVLCCMWCDLWWNWSELIELSCEGFILLLRYRKWTREGGGGGVNKVTFYCVRALLVVVCVKWSTALLERLKDSLVLLITCIQSNHQRRAAVASARQDSQLQPKAPFTHGLLSNGHVIQPSNSNPWPVALYVLSLQWMLETVDWLSWKLRIQMQLSLKQISPALNTREFSPISRIPWYSSNIQNKKHYRIFILAALWIAASQIKRSLPLHISPSVLRSL